MTAILVFIAITDAWAAGGQVRRRLAEGIKNSSCLGRSGKLFCGSAFCPAFTFLLTFNIIFLKKILILEDGMYAPRPQSNSK